MNVCVIVEIKKRASLDPRWDANIIKKEERREMKDRKKKKMVATMLKCLRSWVTKKNSKRDSKSKVFHTIHSGINIFVHDRTVVVEQSRASISLRFSHAQGRGGSNPGHPKTFKYIFVSECRDKNKGEEINHATLIFRRE